jgi:hypothetical protein
MEQRPQLMQRTKLVDVTEETNTFATAFPSRADDIQHLVFQPHAPTEFDHSSNSVLKISNIH